MKVVVSVLVIVRHNFFRIFWNSQDTPRDNAHNEKAEKSDF
jgi:hypothetical protein